MSGARIIRPAFGAAAPALAPVHDAPFDREVTAPPPPPPGDDDRDRRRGPGGPGGEGGQDDAPPEDFGRVVPLGVTTRRGMTAYAFLDANGLQAVHSARDLYQRAVLKSLFGGARATPFLIENWPAAPRGKSKTATDYDAEALGDALMAACSRAGHADGVELRRDGIWPSGAALIFHAGDAVLHPDMDAPGGWGHRNPGWRDGDAVYVYTGQRRERPHEQGASTAEVAELLRAFDLWHYAAPVAPRILLGIVACGLLGMALPWRPHVFLRGVTNAGKSSLARLVASACGAGEPSTNITGGGLQRQFDARSGLIPLDEREADADAVKKVVEIMRGSSDGRGSVTVQTDMSGGGGTVSFRVAGCFLFAAITLPPLTDADVSRITVLHLRRPTEDRRPEVEAADARARELHPKLLARVMRGWERWQANWRVARAAVLRLEATSRCADQLGALMAGWWTLARDSVLTDAEADAEAALLEGFLTTRAAAADGDAGYQVLQHLLASRVMVTERGSDQMTVQAAVIEAMRAQIGIMSADPASMVEARTKADLWDKRLGAVGLRALYDPGRFRGTWPFPGDPSPGLFIGQSHPAVTTAFHHSIWPGGAWRGPIQDLGGVACSAGPVSFRTGGAHRAVFVPLGLLGIGDDDLAGL